MRYIMKQPSESAVQNALDNGILSNPYIAYVEDGKYIDWNTKGADYSKMPLTFEILSAGTIVWKASNSAGTLTIQYSLNDGEWTEITSTTEGVTIPVSAGDVVQFRGDNTRYHGDNYNKGFSKFIIASAATVAGNIMSLITSTGYKTATTVESYAFMSFFAGCWGLTSAKNLVLPATTLGINCYREMFGACTSLTTAPVLPATTLANGCYYQMFRDCYHLVSAPELPATTLTYPCYGRMFENCKKLNYIKCLAITNTGGDYWVYEVSPTGTFVKHPDATWERGVSGIPTGWTVVDADI